MKNAKFTIAEDIIIRLEKSNKSNKIKNISTKTETKPKPKVDKPPKNKKMNISAKTQPMPKVDKPPNNKKMNIKQSANQSNIKNDELQNNVSTVEIPTKHEADREQNIGFDQEPVNLVVVDSNLSNNHQQLNEFIDLPDQNETIESVIVSRSDETGKSQTQLLSHLKKIYETQRSIDNTLKLMLAEMKRNNKT